jgi:hypothetical protein
MIAENKDLEGWVVAFTDDGTFTDESIGVTYRGPDKLPKTVEIYARAFPDMHRELYRMRVTGDIVVVQLALQGTHLGPLSLPLGTVRPTCSPATRTEHWPSSSRRRPPASGLIQAAAATERAGVSAGRLLARKNHITKGRS